MKINYFVGRSLQLTGLLILPSAIWVAEFQRSEPLAIGVLLGSMILFFVGWILAR